VVLGLEWDIAVPQQLVTFKMPNSLKFPLLDSEKVIRME